MWKTLAKEISSPFLCLFGILFLEASIKLFENIYLCRSSIYDLNAAIYAFIFLNSFQKSLITFANDDRLFEDKRHAKDIGNRIWQVIWISLMALLFIIPLSFFIEKFVFNASHVGKMASSYFWVSIWGISLFPIVSILSSFYKAQEKNGLIIRPLMIIFFIGIFLNFTLIPIYHLKGAAFIGLLSKFLFFCFLFWYFLSPTNREKYLTSHCKVDWRAIWKYVKNPNSLFISFFLNLIGWMMISLCMIHQSHEHLSSFAIGSTITFFSMCIPNSLYYVFRSIFYRYRHMQIDIFNWGIAISLFLGSLLAIPCIFFPNSILSIFFEDPLISEHLPRTLYWVGIWILTSYLYTIPLAFVSAHVKEGFYSKVRLGILVFTLFQTFYFMQMMQSLPHVYWIILCIENIIFIFAFSLRAYLLNKKITSLQYGTSREKS